MLKLAIDSTNFNKACRTISSYSGASLATVVDYEAAKTLEAAVRFTPAANVSKIRAASENREFASYPAGFFTPGSPAGIKHRPGVKVSKRGFIAYYLKNRYPDALWSKIEAARKTSLETKLKARGLAKKSWQMIAAALGLEIRVPGFVQKAIASTGKQYPENATATRLKTRAGYGIFCENASPLMAAAGVRGLAALQRALNGRAKYAATNFLKGVFFDLKKIQAKYPGMKVG